jgi:hypothetical protein
MFKVPFPNPRPQNTLETKNTVDPPHPYYCRTCEALHAKATCVYHKSTIKVGNMEDTNASDTCNMMSGGKITSFITDDPQYQRNISGVDRETQMHGEIPFPEVIYHMRQIFKGGMYSHRNKKSPTPIYKDMVTPVEKEGRNTSSQGHIHQKEIATTRIDVDITRWDNNAKVPIPLVEIVKFRY